MSELANPADYRFKIWTEHATAQGQHEWKEPSHPNEIPLDFINFVKSHAVGFPTIAWKSVEGKFYLATLRSKQERAEKLAADLGKEIGLPGIASASGQTVAEVMRTQADRVTKAVDGPAKSTPPGATRNGLSRVEALALVAKTARDNVRERYALAALPAYIELVQRSAPALSPERNFRKAAEYAWKMADVMILTRDGAGEEAVKEAAKAPTSVKVMNRVGWTDLQHCDWPEEVAKAASIGFVGQMVVGTGQDERIYKLSHDEPNPRQPIGKVERLANGMTDPDRAEWAECKYGEVPAEVYTAARLGFTGVMISSSGWRYRLSGI